MRHHLVHESHVQILFRSSLWPKDANAPPLSELQDIRAALERLEATGQLVQTKTAAQVKQLNDLEATSHETVETSEHGSVMRFALWLERHLER